MKFIVRKYRKGYRYWLPVHVLGGDLPLHCSYKAAEKHMLKMKKENESFDFEIERVK